MALLFVALFIPRSSNAETLRYGHIIDTKGSNITLEYRGLGENAYYTCDNHAEACAYVGTSTPEQNTAVIPTIVSKNHSGTMAISSQSFFAGGAIVVLNALYNTADKSPVFTAILPIFAEIDRVIWSKDDVSTLIMSTHGNWIYNPTQNTATPTGNTLGSWRTLSSDGAFLASYEPTTSNKDRQFRVKSTLTGKEWSLKGKVSYWDLLTEKLTLFDFTPDEKNLIYLNDEKGYPTLYKANLAGAKNPFPGTQLITKKYSVMDFYIWDNNTLFFVGNRESPLVWSLYRYDLKKEILEKVSDDIAYSEPLKKVGNQLSFLKVDGRGVSPTLYDPATKTLKKFPVPQTITAPMPTGEVISIGKLKGVLYTPHMSGAQTSYPLLIWLHGGPYRQTSTGYHPYLSYGVYDALLEEAVKSGAAVLKLDYRGSFGYGRAFAESIKNEIGKGDVADVEAALLNIKGKLPIRDAYLIGNSYGGYLALRTIVQNPQQWSGAISINGVTDWQILLEQLGNSIFNVHFGGLLSDANSGLFEQAEILEKTKNLTNQKILLVHAQDDETIPAEQSAVIYSVLKESGKNAELIKYEGEGHVLRKQNILTDLCKKVIVFIGNDALGHCDL